MEHSTGWPLLNRGATAAPCGAEAATGFPVARWLLCGLARSSSPTTPVTTEATEPERLGARVLAYAVLPSARR